MAVKISQLPDATELTGDELVPLVQEGETRHAAASLLGGTRAVTLSLTVPPEVASGDNWNIDATAASRHNGGSIAAFEVEWWDGTGETVTATAGAATLTKTVNETNGTALDATVRALDDIGNASKPETAAATATSANSPPQGPITINAPTQTGKGSTFQVSFSGAADPDADPITYTISDPGTFTFTKTNGITEGEIVDATAPDVASETDVTFSAVAVDDSGAQSASYGKTVTVTVSQVIGVALRATGGSGGTFNHIDEAGNTITTPSASWFNGHPIFGGIADVVIDGQDMVEIPKFYVKRATAGGDAAWWISDQPLTGYEVHPAFLLDGVEVDNFHVGKYQASEIGGELASVPGVSPKVYWSLDTFLTYGTNRNYSGATGFRIWHYKMWTAIQWLYLVELASMDCQATTGAGRVNQTYDANVDAADVAQATYRGIVGLWGNVHQWLDGVRAYVGVVETRDYTATSWTATGENVPNNGGKCFPITFRTSSPLYFFPATFAGSNDSTATTPDAVQWGAEGNYYPYVGGHWADGDEAGLWYINCSTSPSSSDYGNVRTGTRIARIV